MSAFIDAMDFQAEPPLMKIGVNGANVITEEGVGNKLVALYTMLVRNSTTVKKDMDKLVDGASPQLLKDLWILAFQTRDIRGGKGERALFYSMFSSLKLTVSKPALKALLSLIPEYGCYVDFLHLGIMNPECVPIIFKIFKETIEEDEQKIVDDELSNLSLLAKWLPREGSRWDNTNCSALSFSKYLYPLETDDTIALMKYRKRVSAINKILKTVEIDMCKHTWANIKPGTVPGKCLKTHTRAFLNLKTMNKFDRIKNNELRFPLSDDRMACRSNFQSHFEKVLRGEEKVNGSDTVMPHEIITKIYENEEEEDEDVLRSLQGQWNSIRDKVLESGGFRKIVPLADFSGSMDGVPKMVSLALAILISEVNSPAFRNRMISFDSTPTWHSFVDGASLKEKVRSVGDIGQGLSTNVEAALTMILDRMVAAQVPVGEEPEDILVLTDMGWNRLSCGLNSSEYATILDSFRLQFLKAGGWKVPRFIVWNLRAEYKDFHARAETEGVVFLSGWSPAVLKTLQTGGVEVETPLQGVRAQLDQPRYDLVRNVFKTT